MKLNFKAAAQSQPKSAGAPKGLHRIMLVDDEIPNLNALSRHLASEFEVVSFTSAKEALRLIDRGGPDSEISVVITDQIMPEMSGVEFLTELQKRQHPAPRIILTGFAALENVVTAVNQAAIFRYLAKPIDIDFMLQAIREAISTVEMRHENSLLLTMVKGLLEKNAELQKLLPPDAPEISRDLNATFPPQRHEVVVVFADIRGFTRASKGAEPELVIQALNQVFQPFHEIIYNAGGVVDKHLGDGLMAIFGLLGGNSRNAALMATQLMVERATLILPTLKEPMHELKISFGVAAGTVVLGMMGSSFRSELAIIGETANFGARLQEISKQALSPAGQKNFGIFDRSIAVCSANLLGLNANFKKVDLNGEILIRDFSEIITIGVYNPTSTKP